MSKVIITIDDKEIWAEQDSILLEEARKNGFAIPSLCHDPRLQPFGSCRQCLVEIEGARGLVQACGARVQEGMLVRTNTENIRSIRKLGLELLLTEHCGDCLAPCRLACPAGIDIQGFIAHIANGQLKEAARLIREKLPFPASIGRVCPRFCETDCRRNLIDGPVAICSLKRYVGDELLQDRELIKSLRKPDTGRRIAVVGGGPAGLTAAYYLALEGYMVSIFEACPELGGMMRYGIPEYRLPKALLDQEIGIITDLCADVFCNTTLGKDFTIDRLKMMGYDAIFVGIGSWANQSLGIANEDLAMVYSGIGFLREIAMGNPVTLGNSVVIIGGGNTAMDAARTAVRLGVSDVTVVYRRSREEMPANPHEVTQAEEEGVKFEFLTAPVSFSGEGGKVQAIQCVKMQLGPPDNSGRRRPLPLKGSDFSIPVDTVITATGQKLDASCLAASPELPRNRWGDIDVDSATLQSGREWLFAGGDCATGPATAVEAIAAGRKAALSIHQYLSGQSVTPELKPFNCSRGSLSEIDPEEFSDKERISRTDMPTVTPKLRKDNFQEFELGFTAELARREASRCLSCGCLDVFTCRLRDYASELAVDPHRLGLSTKKYSIADDHPYIIRDSNKCILCGNCVRVCQEIQGVGALGFVNRGSQTVVLPSLMSPLSDTLCKSCGQCVAVCPTGALTRKNSLAKPGPWKTEKIESVCPYCSVGCKLVLERVGDRIVGITSPILSDTVNEGNLCNKGSFGYLTTTGQDRLTKPLIRKNGRYEEVSWEEAMEECAAIYKDIILPQWSDSWVVVLSSQLTNEESLSAYKLGVTVLGTENVFSSVPVAISSVAFKTPSPAKATFKGLQESDLIVVVGDDFSEKYPIAVDRINQAVKHGSKLVIISSDVNRLHRLAKQSLKVKNKKLQPLFETFLSYIFRYHLVEKQIAATQQELIKELQQQVPEDYFETIQDFLVKPDKIIQVIQLYLRAKNPVILVDGQTIAPELLDLLTGLALLTGNPNSPSRGIMPLYPQGNSQGQIDLGIKAGIREYRKMVERMKTGQIKGLLVFEDEQPVDPELFQPGVKAVGITARLSAINRYDVVLPASTFLETSGSYTNCEGRIQHLQQVFAPKGKKDILQIISEIAAAFGYTGRFPSTASAHSDVLMKILGNKI